MRINELLIDEEYLTSVCYFDKTVSELENYEFIEDLDSNGKINGGGNSSPTPPRFPSPWAILCSWKQPLDYLDGWSNPLDPEKVRQFEQLTDGKKGIYVVWCVEYDASYWFIEIDQSEVAQLLTSKYKLLRDLGKEAL